LYPNIFVFWEEFSEMSQNWNPLDVKIRPVGAELLCADGQTNLTKPRVAFYNFVNVPENETCCMSSTRLAQVFVQFNSTLYIEV